MADIQSFDQLYVELCERMALKMPHIVHQDLWSDQVSFEETEHPFPTPALFYEFRGVDSADLSQLAQLVDLQVDVYLFYETFLDTSHGSYNKQDAVDYLKDLSDINKHLHGFKGEHVDGMRRVTFGRVQTGGAGNLYRTIFTANTRDHSAVKDADGILTNEMDIKRETLPVVDEDSTFIID